MNIDQAKQLREDLKYLIGKQHNDFTVRDVVITPVNGEDFNKWVVAYHYSMDVYNSILPYSGSDLMVEFVYLLNGQGYEHNGVFLHGNVLVEAKKRFDIEIDLEEYGIKK